MTLSAVAVLFATTAAHATVAKDLVGAYKQVGRASPAAKGQAAYRALDAQLESMQIGKPGGYKRFLKISKARSEALVSINQTLSKENGERSPRRKTLRAALATEQRQSRALNFIKPGASVRVGELREGGGGLVADEHLAARTANSTGTVVRHVPGHGGDVWFVRHSSREVASYSINELKPEKEKHVKTGGLWLGDN